MTETLEVHNYKVSWEGVVNGQRFVKCMDVPANTPDQAKSICENSIGNKGQVLFISSNIPGFQKIYCKKKAESIVTVTLPTGIENEDWFKALVEDANSTITEAMFTANWSLIEGYHSLGKLVEDNKKKFLDSGIANPVPLLAKHINKSERTVYRAVQFFNTYPDLAVLPEGKNTSWHKIVNKYLPTGKNGDKEESIRLQFTVGEIGLIVKALEQYCFNSRAENREVGLNLISNLQKRKGVSND